MIARAEHVWVSDVKVWADVPQPGLLLEWRAKSEGGWEGLVIAVESFPGGGNFQVRQRWVDATMIRRRED